MTQDELYEMWLEDGRINKASLTDESLRTPNLHGKYLRIYGLEKRRLRKMETELEVLKYDMDEFVNMGHSEGLKRGWKTPPCGHIKEKSKRERYVAVETHVVTKQLEVAEQAIIVDALNAILKEITQRGWQIRNAIEYEKFVNP